MSRRLTLNQGRQTPPAGSGRSTPEVGRHRNPPEDGEKHKDKSYRKYAAGIDRALSTGDNAQQEWADYISFLGRLHKAIQAHQGNQVEDLPYKFLIAKRLAQCLNPSLPSGVHQKALELYNYIFSIIKKEGLGRDLYIYLPSLLSVLSFASLSIRPYFLTLFEKYILRLDSASLRPALKAIILSLLPGLEDESSEDFDRILRILWKLKILFESSKGGEEIAEDESYFWQCLFIATVTNPSRRQGALAFFMRKLPKFASSSDRNKKTVGNVSDSAEQLTEAARIVRPEPGLLIRSFISGMADTQILTQRGFLDLLVSRLPLDSLVLQKQADPDDLERLVTCAVGVVIRRDMSLNRRLWTWFIGPDKDEESEDKEGSDDNGSLDARNAKRNSYFGQYGSGILTRSLLRMIRKNSTIPAERAKPFRILLSLMDRWEVGATVIPKTFIPAIENVYAYSETSPSTITDEVVRSASMFFDGVESNLIWSNLLEYILLALEMEEQSIAERLRRLKIIKFVIMRFHIREEEMVLGHIPIVSLAIFAKLSAYIEHISKKTPNVLDDTVDLGLELCIMLVSEVPHRGFTVHRQPSGAERPDSLAMPADTDIWRAVQKLYRDQEDISDLSEFPEFSSGTGYVFLHKVMISFRTILYTKSDPRSVELCGKLLQLLLRKTLESRPMNYIHFLKVLHQDLSRLSDHYNTAVPFEIISAVMGNLSVITSVLKNKGVFFSDKTLSALLVLIINLAWHYLDPLTPQHHMEAYRCLCQIHELTSSKRLVESVLASQIGNSRNENGVKSGKSLISMRRFTVVWGLALQQQSTYSEMFTQTQDGKNEKKGQPNLYHLYPGALTRPLFLLLDCLHEDDMELYNFVQEWLYFIPSVDMLMDAILKHLAFSSVSLYTETLSTSFFSEIRVEWSPEHVTRETRYYMQHLLFLLKDPPTGLWDYLLTNTLPHQVPQYDSEHSITVQDYITSICFGIISKPDYSEIKFDSLRINSLKVIELLQSTPHKEAIEESSIDQKLVDILNKNLKTYSCTVQMSFLDALRMSLLSKFQTGNVPDPTIQAGLGDVHGHSLDTGAVEKEEKEAAKTILIKNLIECSMKGISLQNHYFGLNNWTTFLFDCAPLWSQQIFQHLIPVVSTICNQIELVFTDLHRAFYREFSTTVAPEETVILLLTTLQNVQSIAAQRLMTDDYERLAAKGHEPSQGFLGNVVSNPFSSETTPASVAGQNNSLTLVLCYQDSLKTCFRLWVWGTHFSASTQNIRGSTQASFSHTSMRVRNKARQLMEHMFNDEAMEVLENLAYMWVQDSPSGDTAKSVLAFLQVIDGSKPKNIMPAIFNALYSRTNPTAIESARLSTYTSKISETELAAFLLTYTETLEDDTLDEIWGVCMTFLSHVLANPLPQRQIIPVLLEFTVMLAEKLDNTNFGEQRKMRKELSDTFMRLLTATFTTKPMSQYQSRSRSSGFQESLPYSLSVEKRLDLLEVLCVVVPKLSFLFTDHDRISTVLTSISNNVTITMIRSKSYPDNMSATSIRLMLSMLKTPAMMKNWKRDVSEALYDNRFTQFSYTIVKDQWLPLLSQWATLDKDCMTDLVSRISAPSAAGIMFGVGAASARLEADRKTQHALRRLALIVLSIAADKPIGAYNDIETKINELLTATTATSPSSVTRADTYMLLQALIMQCSGSQLATLWTIITSELQSVFASLFSEDSQSDKYNTISLLQAAKLLDLLIVLSPDDFQLHEWLFITDTIDAVYKPPDWKPTALADDLAENLDTTGLAEAANQTTFGGTSFLMPLLSDDVNSLTKDELVRKVLTPFFGHLSIASYESMYKMAGTDVEARRVMLLRDLLDQITLL